MAVIKVLLITLLLAIFAFENVELQTGNVRDPESFHSWKELAERMEAIGSILMQFFKNALRFIKNVDGDDEPVDKATADLKKAMFQGAGGTTLISYYVAGKQRKQVIVNNGNKTICSQVAYITGDGVVCDGERLNAPYSNCQPGKVMTRREKDTYCLSDEPGPKAYKGDNDEVDLEPLDSWRTPKCSGTMVSKEALLQQCGPNVFSFTYATATYIPDKTQSNRVAIPNPNPYLGCTEAKSYYCTFQIGLRGPK